MKDKAIIVGLIGFVLIAAYGWFMIICNIISWLGHTLYAESKY